MTQARKVQSVRDFIGYLGRAVGMPVFIYTPTHNGATAVFRENLPISGIFESYHVRTADEEIIGNLLIMGPDEDGRRNIYCVLDSARTRRHTEFVHGILLPQRKDELL
ncbi:MAG: hypothetical protein HYW26_03420 [Candidatus Aenigmarchaeota archaeon]|nr:hypothetical protein [Candidatus Aenigmarchaeota archaeon]